MASGPSGVGRNLRQIRFQLSIIILRIQTSESYELAHAMHARVPPNIMVRIRELRSPKRDTCWENKRGRNK